MNLDARLRLTAERVELTEEPAAFGGTKITGHPVPQQMSSVPRCCRDTGDRLTPNAPAPRLRSGRGSDVGRSFMVEILRCSRCRHIQEGTQLRPRETPRDCPA
ncbi:hypothetical protein GFS60_04713 [Rhodococcus sp. WAY2]|nr:hypothetical protein GFS60_04713 [Rhodococcus sp. WAY2]